jgi:hypothetical protein
MTQYVEGKSGQALGFAIAGTNAFTINKPHPCGILYMSFRGVLVEQVETRLVSYRLQNITKR